MADRRSDDWRWVLLMSPAARSDRERQFDRLLGNGTGFILWILVWLLLGLVAIVSIARLAVGTVLFERDSVLVSLLVLLVWWFGRRRLAAARACPSPRGADEARRGTDGPTGGPKDARAIRFRAIAGRRGR
jgi:hypothetical protein